MDALRKSLEQYRLKLERYQQLYADLLAERHLMQDRLDLLEKQYSTVENAEFWKLTKPFRWVLDRIKASMRKRRVLRKLGKAIRYVKKNGLRYSIKEWNESR